MTTERLVAVVGSREYPRLDLVEAFVAAGGMHVVTGDADGVDRTAWTTARSRSMAYTIFPYNRALGRSGGFARNVRIVAFAGEMACFWDGESRGTAHDIHLWYMKTGTQPLVYDVDGTAIIVPHHVVQSILHSKNNKAEPARQ